MAGPQPGGPIRLLRKLRRAPQITQGPHLPLVSKRRSHGG